MEHTLPATAAELRNKRNTLGVVNRGPDDSISVRARARRRARDQPPIASISAIIDTPG